MLTQQNHSRRLRIAAISAVAAVLARIVSIFTWPPDSDASHAKMVATAGAHRVSWLIATYAEVACWLLAGFAVLTVVRLAPGRGYWATQIGGWVYGTSLIVLSLVGGSQNVTTMVLAEQPHRAAMVATEDALHASAAMAPFVMLIVFGELFAMAFGVGLARARVIGWWFPATSLVALVVYILTGDSSDPLVVLAGFLPLGATWLGLARLLWTPSTAVLPAATPLAALAG